MRYIEAFVLCARIACLYAKNSEYECFVSDAKTSEENPLRHIFPTTLDEFKVFEYNGVLCNECNDTYDGPCPLHVLKYVASRPKPSTYLHHRAEKTAPKNILRLEESCIPDAGAGIWTIKRIPKNVVFGPLDGDIVERKNNKTIDIGNYWKIPGTEKSYIDLLDKSKANYMAYINCARNVKEENLIKYFNETDQKFYFKSKTPISKYSELLVDYGTEFRKLIGISDLDFSRPRELKNTGVSCSVCKKTYYNIGYMRLYHQGVCREAYEKLVKDNKAKPHIVYRRGRYKMVQYKHDLGSTRPKQTTADWREFYYDNQEFRR